MQPAITLGSAALPHPLWVSVPAALLAAVLLAVGLRLLVRLRRGQSLVVRLPLLGPSSHATGLAVSFSSLILGYHLLAWTLPPDWLQLRVPAHRWWLLVLGAGLAIGLSWMMDRGEQPEEWSDASGASDAAPDEPPELSRREG